MQRRIGQTQRFHTRLPAPTRHEPGAFASHRLSDHSIRTGQPPIARFPFPIIGIDSDNGSEFINHHLFNYCAANKITFTRGRSGQSNDGAHVEQKNWTHVRSMVGYLRYDTPGELELLNETWVLDAGLRTWSSLNRAPAPTRPPVNRASVNPPNGDF